MSHCRICGRNFVDHWGGFGYAVCSECSQLNPTLRKRLREQIWQPITVTMKIYPARWGTRDCTELPKMVTARRWVLPKDIDDSERTDHYRRLREAAWYGKEEGAAP